MIKTKYNIQKCYLVQVTDEKENELACEYVFEDREGALRDACLLKKRVDEELREEEMNNGI